MKKKLRKTDSNFNTPYDDAHQTMVTECPTLLIPVVNEMFHKNYSRHEQVVLSNRNYMVNLQDGEQQKRITDSVFTIRMEDYLLENQSTIDGTIIMRIFEYSSQEAIAKSEFKDNVLITKFPNAAIIYLRHNENTPDEMSIEIRVSGDSCKYQVPVVKVQKYTVEELFDKELYFFIPFHIFAYEKEFESFEQDEVKLKKLQQIYVNIVERLDEHARKGRLTEFEKRTVIAMAKKVIEKIANKHSNVKNEIGGVMGGKVLDYEAKDILRQGIEQGIEQGVALGVAESRKEMIGNALNRGNTPETIADFMGIPLAEVEAIEKQLKSE